MLPGPAWAILTDPVCGRSVELTSPHRAVHGGALFAFCSVSCQSNFMELPSRYAVIMPSVPVSLLEPSTPAVTPAPPRPRPASAGRASAPMPLAAVPAAMQPTSARPAASSADPTAASLRPQPVRQAAEPQPGTSSRPAPLAAGDASRPHASASWAPLPEGMDLQGERGPFTWLLARRERRYARDCAREMLKLHHDFSSRFPELKGHSLYRRVVARRLDGNDLVAEAVLHHATQSFAIWPVERELNFRDVVHYLAVSQYVALHPGARWVHADIKRLVEDLIPPQL